MKQSIAGVSPPDVEETTIMTIWPSLAATPTGQFLGRLYAIRWGIGWLTLGKLFALASIPVALGLFFWMLLPGIMQRYRLTNRRVIVERQTFSFNPLQWFGPRRGGGRLLPIQWVDLERFDSIEVVVHRGQQWYPAGDLIFRNGQVETFRLLGVSRPETFRRTCLEAHLGYGGVRKAMGS